MPTTASINPDPSTPRRVAMNRSFTVPSRLASTPRSAEVGAAEGIETLYIHPRANIVKFATSSLSRPSSTSGSPRAGSQPGQRLSWSTTTESTIAAGPLEIYRVPGSVSFLHSGALLHAILPRSQCWCVDGVSKFALRVLPETYYRIELPGETAEELDLVEALKEVLKKVLFYERTPCPFVRGFEVEGADVDLEKEVRKGRRKSAGSAKRWTLNRPYSWRPEDGEEIPEEGTGESSSEGSGRDESGGRSESQSAGLNEKQATPSRVPPRDFGGMRSITAPPQLSKRPSVRARVQSVELTEAQRIERGPRPLSMRGLRTLQPIPTNMPPSPPESSVGADPHEIEPAVETPSESKEHVATKVGHDFNDDNGVRHDSNEVEGEEREHDLDNGEQDQDQDHDDSAIPFQLQPPEPRTSFSTQTSSFPEATASHIQQQKHSDGPLARDASPPPQLEAPTAHRRAPSQPPAVDQTLYATTSSTPIASPAPADPYAAIQARIHARRTLSSPSSPQPKAKPSVPSLRPKPSLANLPHNYPNQQSLPTALASKALTLFLGPPAHLVAIMLRIAARFAKGRGVGSVFLVESPPGARKVVPGGWEGIDGVVDEVWEEGEGDEEGEDDFGVPLTSPVRVMRGS